VEDRLPFIFIWLPQWFKSKYPKIVENLKNNKNRLVSPFDIHETLKHILELSRSSTKQTFPSLGCPQCRSIFKEIPSSRSCEEAGIDDQWCACLEYSDVDKQSKKVVKKVKKIIEFVIESVNKDLVKNVRNHSEPLCHKVRYKNTLMAKKSKIINEGEDDEYVDFLVSFTVFPSDGIFEATVRSYKDESKDLFISGSIGRLNEYWNQSHCVADSTVKVGDYRKFCYCLVQES
jgi:hypothetical protein